MDDDTARSPASGIRQPRRAFGVSLAIAGLTAMGLLAACGGGSKDLGAAGAGGTATATAGSGFSGAGSSGETSQAQPGKDSCMSRKRLISAMVRPPPALSPPTAM